jgi:sialic acid synthase SpsE
MKISINRRNIGDAQPIYIVAEIGSNFNGDLQRAKHLVNLAKECGADAVKFQSFITDKIISKEGFKSIKKGFQAKWKKPVYEVYKNAEFPRNWHSEIFKYCKKKKITVFSTPYDLEAVDLLEELNVPVYKIGSGDITWLEFIEYIARKGKPIILGTGASSMQEINEAVETIKSAGNNKFILLQCVTNYPSSFQNANIKAMLELRKKFHCLVGCSDHTPGHIVPLGMTSLGGCLIEKHFTDNKTRIGPDHPFAMDKNDFEIMVKSIRLLEKALGSEKKIYDEERETVILQRRCLRAAMDIRNGTILTRKMIDVLRPAPNDSISPKYLTQIVGKRVNKDVEKGNYFTWQILGD